VNKVPPRVILASQSPRRLALLTEMGLPVEVSPAELDEVSLPGEEPEAQAQRLAWAKAEQVAQAMPEVLVIAADTLVVLEGRVLGKPRSRDEAISMLTRLRGRRHVVHTGLALAQLSSSLRSVQLATTSVQMRAYSEPEMRAYVASGDPMDKAGAYAIQNDAFEPVQRLDGCYANVVGLPLCHLYRVLAGWGLAPPYHPLERCPWAVQNRGCPWARGILMQEIRH